MTTDLPLRIQRARLHLHEHPLRPKYRLQDPENPRLPSTHTAFNRLKPKPNPLPQLYHPSLHAQPFHPHLTPTEPPPAKSSPPPTTPSPPPPPTSTAQTAPTTNTTPSPSPTSQNPHPQAHHTDPQPTTRNPAPSQKILQQLRSHPANQ